jgi:RNA methyltransferase, TrmH family
MITSPDNEKLKTVRRLSRRRERERTGMFVAEGEDLIAAAEAAGAQEEFVLVAGVNVEPALLDAVSALGSGTRSIGVYRQRWSEVNAGPPGDLALYLHGVADPGNIGTAIRSVHALCDGPAVLGPGCADPYSPKAVRASMGSVFARPPARAPAAELPGTLLALDPGAEPELGELDVLPPAVVAVGAEREGLPVEVLERADARARIAMRRGGPDSLNAAMAATIALYELGRRITGR